MSLPDGNQKTGESAADKDSYEAMKSILLDILSIVWKDTRPKSSTTLWKSQPKSFYCVHCFKKIEVKRHWVCVSDSPQHKKIEKPWSIFKGCPVCKHKIETIYCPHSDCLNKIDLKNDEYNEEAIEHRDSRAVTRSYVPVKIAWSLVGFPVIINLLYTGYFLGGLGEEKALFYILLIALPLGFILSQKNYYTFPNPYINPEWKKTIGRYRIGFVWVVIIGLFISLGTVNNLIFTTLSYHKAIKEFSESSSEEKMLFTLIGTLEEGYKKKVELEASANKGEKIFYPEVVQKYERNFPVRTFKGLFLNDSSIDWEKQISEEPTAVYNLKIGDELIAPFKIKQNGGIYYEATGRGHIVVARSFFSDYYRLFAFDKSVKKLPKSPYPFPVPLRVVNFIGGSQETELKVWVLHQE